MTERPGAPSLGGAAPPGARRTGRAATRRRCLPAPAWAPGELLLLVPGGGGRPSCPYYPPSSPTFRVRPWGLGPAGKETC